MPLNAFRIDRLNSLYCQCLRCTPRSRIKIACLDISCGQRIDHVLVLPRHETASGLGIFDRLSAIAKRRVWTSRLKPGTVAQRPRKSNTPRMDRNEIIKLSFAPAVSPCFSRSSAFVNRFMTARRPLPYPTMIGTLALIAVALAIIAIRSEVIFMDVILL
jgi:hypothetical protein